MRVLFVVIFLGCPVIAQELVSIQAYPDGQLPNDVRLRPLKDLNGHFPFRVPSTRSEWERRRAQLKQRVQIATGLWPLPAKTPLKAVVHGLAERDGFTVQKVYFESLPDHFVTGLLFRPARPGTKRPAVLSPHGHGGRNQDYGEKNMERLIKEGAETFAASGRFPKIARCAQLARMGCVVFLYDMLGYVDSQQISYQLAHRFAKQRPEFDSPSGWGFYSTQAELRLQSIMGLQTWNSIRALDFLCGLDDVDASRIGVTGGSGGGTQTILLSALDDRVAAAFPQGMVSTSMQGGCTCENCCLLRIGTGNVELAGLFAPRPQAMTAAKDWTVAMMADGFPQLKKLYALYGKSELVDCRPYLHFPHNYNAVSRRDMYRWFNKHLRLGANEPIAEQDYPPLSAGETSVWTNGHHQPKADPTYESRLLRRMAVNDDRAMKNLLPQDHDSLNTYREVIGGAWKTIIHRGMPGPEQIERKKIRRETKADHVVFTDILRFDERGEEFPVVSLYPTSTPWNRNVIVWLDGTGKQALFDREGRPRTEVQQLLDGGCAVVSADLYLQGEFLVGKRRLTQSPVVQNPREFAGYTFGYNDTVLVRRVHDLMTLVSWVRADSHKPSTIRAVAVGGTAPVLAAAMAVEPGLFSRAVLDTEGFRFSRLKSYRDPDFVPGAVKYGDFPGLLSLAAPTPLRLVGEPSVPAATRSVYRAAGADDRVDVLSDPDGAAKGISWLLE